MAKKTIYGTAMTIRQIKSILKKTEQIERRIADKESAPPDLIMISFSPTKGKWIVLEDYMCRKKVLQNRIVKEITVLQDYIFPANYYGQVLLDMMEHPEGNVYSFNSGLFRVEHGLMKKEFSLKFVQDGNDLNGEFNLIIYDRKENEK